MCGTVVDKSAVKIMWDINNDLMAIPGRVKGTTVYNGGTDPTGCSNHKRMGARYVVGGKEIAGSFMKSKTCHVWIISD